MILAHIPSLKGAAWNEFTGETLSSQAPGQDSQTASIEAKSNYGYCIREQPSFNSSCPVREYLTAASVQSSMYRRLTNNCRPVFSSPSNSKSSIRVAKYLEIWLSGLEMASLAARLFLAPQLRAELTIQPCRTVQYSSKIKHRCSWVVRHW